MDPVWKEAEIGVKAGEKIIESTVSAAQTATQEGKLVLKGARIQGREWRDGFRNLTRRFARQPRQIGQ